VRKGLYPQETWVCGRCGTRYKIEYKPTDVSICMCRPYTMPSDQRTDAERMEAFRDWQKFVNKQ